MISLPTGTRILIAVGFTDMLLRSFPHLGLRVRYVLADRMFTA
jgi:hypothetical protein